jgi:hypothetical protein
MAEPLGNEMAGVGLALKPVDKPTRAGLLESLGLAVKTALGLNPDIEANRKVPFAGYGGGVAGGWSLGGSDRSYLTGQPGAAYDYRAAAGNLLDNSVVINITVSTRLFGR